MAVSQKKAKSAVVIWAAADKNSPAMTCGEGEGGGLNWESRKKGGQACWMRGGS